VLIISRLFVKLFPDRGKINREFFLSVDPEELIDPFLIIGGDCAGSGADRFACKLQKV
jgi:hypothetical protein